MPDATITVLTGSRALFSGRVDLAKIIRGKLHDHTPELRDMEISNIQARTPIDSGALQSSVEGIAFTQDGEDLATVYYNDEEQIAQWGRIYALYQEGSQFGLSTYTNAPHEMIGSSLTDDIPMIEDWAKIAADEGFAEIGVMP